MSPTDPDMGLTDADRDALYRELTAVMPSIPREDLPDVVNRLIEWNFITLTLTPTEIFVEFPEENQRFTSLQVRRRSLD